MLPGDLVFYDKCGGVIQTVFPFGDPYDQGLGIVVSKVMQYYWNGEDVSWVWILDENGNQLDFALDYLKLAII